MPYIIGWPPRRGVALIAACLGMLVSAAPAAARGDVAPPSGGFPTAPTAPQSSSCPTAPVSQKFAKFGDLAYYSLIPGGSFDGPMGGWSLTGAATAPGNEPLLSSGGPGARMLQIAPNGEVVSQTFCLSNAMPTWRFVLQTAGLASNGNLNVWVQWTDASGATGQVPVTALSSSVFGSWAPSPVLTAGSGLPDNTTVNAQLVFSADAGGSWQVDDVYIDPYAR